MILLLQLLLRLLLLRLRLLLLLTIYLRRLSVSELKTLLLEIG